MIPSCEVDSPRSWAKIGMIGITTPMAEPISNPEPAMGHTRWSSLGEVEVEGMERKRRGTRRMDIENEGEEGELMVRYTWNDESLVGL